MAVTSVRVAARVRPLTPGEARDGCASAVAAAPEGGRIVVGDRDFAFDAVFGPADGNAAIYEAAVLPLLQAALAGYNVTIFAYGQTGSGKTHTMNEGFEDSGVTAKSGITPRLLADLFTVLPTGAVAYTVTASCVEVYNEGVYDLLSEKGARDAQSVIIRDNEAGDVVVTGVVEAPVTSAAEACATLRRGLQSRATASTHMNARSSRSHAVFTLAIRQTVAVAAAGTATATAAGAGASSAGDDLAGDGDACLVVRTSKIVLVDLAGSERAKKTGAEGDRLREAASINKGLLALGNVINALAGLEDAAAAPTPATAAAATAHIPFRDSKLTRLLKSSLGGNAHTLMVACVSPADVNVDETLSTLRYAARARAIKNRAVVNVDPVTAQMTALRARVAELERQLLEARAGVAPAATAAAAHGSGASRPPSGMSDSVGSIEGAMAAMMATESTVATLSEQLAAATEHAAALQDELQTASAQYAALTDDLSAVEEGRDAAEWRLDQLTSACRASVKRFVADAEATGSAGDVSRAFGDIVIALQLIADYVPPAPQAQPLASRVHAMTAGGAAGVPVVGAHDVVVPGSATDAASATAPDRAAAAAAAAADADTGSVDGDGALSLDMSLLEREIWADFPFALADASANTTTLPGEVAAQPLGLALGGSALQTASPAASTSSATSLAAQAAMRRKFGELTQRLREKSAQLAEATAPGIAGASASAPAGDSSRSAARSSAEAATEAKRLTQHVTQLEARLSVAERERAALQRSLEAAALASKKATLTPAVGAAPAAADGVDALRAQVTRAEDTIRRLQGEIREARRAAAASDKVGARTTHLAAEVAALKAARAAMQRHMREAAARAAAEKQEVQRLAARAAVLADRKELELARATRATEDLTARMRRKEEELARARRQVAEARAHGAAHSTTSLTAAGLQSLLQLPTADAAAHSELDDVGESAMSVRRGETVDFIARTAHMVGAVAGGAIRLGDATARAASAAFISRSAGATSQSADGGDAASEEGEADDEASDTYGGSGGDGLVALARCLRSTSGLHERVPSDVRSRLDSFLSAHVALRRAQVVKDQLGKRRAAVARQLADGAAGTSRALEQQRDVITAQIAAVNRVIVSLSEQVASYSGGGQRRSTRMLTPQLFEKDAGMRTVMWLVQALVDVAARCDSLAEAAMLSQEAVATQQRAAQGQARQAQQEAATRAAAIVARATDRVVAAVQQTEAVATELRAAAIGASLTVTGGAADDSDADIYPAKAHPDGGSAAAVAEAAATLQRCVADVTQQLATTRAEIIALVTEPAMVAKDALDVAATEAAAALVEAQAASLRAATSALKLAGSSASAGAGGGSRRPRGGAQPRTEADEGATAPPSPSTARLPVWAPEAGLSGAALPRRAPMAVSSEAVDEETDGDGDVAMAQAAGVGSGDHGDPGGEGASDADESDDEPPTSDDEEDDDDDEDSEWEGDGRRGQRKRGGRAGKAQRGKAKAPPRKATRGDDAAAGTEGLSASGELVEVARRPAKRRKVAQPQPRTSSGSEGDVVIIADAASQGGGNAGADGGADGDGDGEEVVAAPAAKRARKPKAERDHCSCVKSRCGTKACPCKSAGRSCSDQCRRCTKHGCHNGCASPPGASSNDSADAPAAVVAVVPSAAPRPSEAASAAVVVSAGALATTAAATLRPARAATMDIDSDIIPRISPPPSPAVPAGLVARTQAVVGGTAAVGRAPLQAGPGIARLPLGAATTAGVPAVRAAVPPLLVAHSRPSTAATTSTQPAGSARAALHGAGPHGTLPRPTIPTAKLSGGGAASAAPVPSSSEGASSIGVGMKRPRAETAGGSSASSSSSAPPPLSDRTSASLNRLPTAAPATKPAVLPGSSSSWRPAQAPAPVPASAPSIVRSGSLPSRAVGGGVPAGPVAIGAAVAPPSGVRTTTTIPPARSLPPPPAPGVGMGLPASRAVTVAPGVVAGRV